MRKIKLGEVLDVKRGASLSGDYYSKEGTLIRLTLGNFNYPGRGFKQNTSKEDLYYNGPVRDEFIMEEGDIITPLTEQVRGLLGETAIIPESDKYVQSGDIGKIIPVDKLLDKDFAPYLISSPVVKRQLDTASQQTKIRHTSPDKIKDCIAWIPKIDDQKQIGQLLKNIDNKIKNNKEVNYVLESLTKTLYDYWFLQFEFPNEEGKPYKSSGGKMVCNEELKIEIPEGWKSCILGDFYKSQTGYAFKSTEWKNTGHPVLTIKAIEDNGNVNMDEASFISERYNDSLNKYSAKNGNLIFAMSGNTIGKIGLIASNIQNVLINQRVLIIDTSTENVAYPYFTLNCPEIQNKIRQLGTNSAQPNISESQLNNIKIVKPDSHILNIYNEKCAPIFKQIISNRIQNQQLSSLRNWLLPMLMNGQVTFEKKKDTA